MPHTLPVVEFYITNVCNLTCEHCNRFNNYVFRGWQRWQDHAQDYAAWADLLDFEIITILGGEPLLNPTVLEWCTGIRELWPRAHIHLTTNGYHINRVKGLREVLHRNRILLEVVIHRRDDEQWMLDQIQQFLHGAPVTEVAMPDNITHYRSPLMRAGVWTMRTYSFLNSSLRRQDDGTLTLHQSDPDIAHSRCSFVHHRTHHMIRGQLYKCGPVALMPEFDSQYPLAITQQERDLLHSYKPYTAQDFAQRGSEILAHIQQPLAQCRFCPENFEWHNIQAQPKSQFRTINIAKRS